MTSFTHDEKDATGRPVLRADESPIDGAPPESASVLPVYCFDIDGTICTNTEGAYEEAIPFGDAIAAVNALYERGHRIYLYTARGSGTGIDWRELTERQMRTWGVRYHLIFMGKPSADIYVDDKTINADAWRRSGFTLTLSEAKHR